MLPVLGVAHGHRSWFWLELLLEAVSKCCGWWGLQQCQG